VPGNSGVEKVYWATLPLTNAQIIVEREIPKNSLSGKFANHSRLFHYNLSFLCSDCTLPENGQKTTKKGLWCTESPSSNVLVTTLNNRHAHSELVWGVGRSSLVVLSRRGWSTGTSTWRPRTRSRTAFRTTVRPSHKITTYLTKKRLPLTCTSYR